MIKEIYEQPEVVQRIIDEHIDMKNKRVLFKDFAISPKRISGIKRFILVGCGTSYHAALLGKYFLASCAGIESEAEYADEFAGRKARVDKDTLVIAISQSGKTGDEIKAARAAKKQKALVIAITNAIDSPLDRLSDYTIFNQAGQEQALAATKTFTSQILLLAAFAVFIGQNKKTANTKICSQFFKEIGQLPKKIAGILKQNVHFEILANKYCKSEGLLVLGKGFQFPLALEAALKIKESTYIHGEGFAAGEFLHGPLAICNKNMPCLFFAPRDECFKELKAIIKRIKSLKRKALVFSSAGNRQLLKLADDAVFLPKTIDIFFPLLAIIPLQILAYHIALLRGVNPDKPRYLNKFVG